MPGQRGIGPGERGGAQVTPVELLEACGPSAACTLQQLDAHPDLDVLVQLARCEARTGPYVNDCAAHAIQRWARGYPDAAEVDRVVVATHKYAVQVGTFVGMVVACAPAGPVAGPAAASGRAACPGGEDLVAVACRRGAEGYGRGPASCGGVLPPETVSPAASAVGG